MSKRRLSTLERIGLASGLASPIVAFTCILSAIASYPEFSWTHNALSDLGILEGITAPLFNIGLCISGFLGFLFSVFALYPFLKQHLTGKLGSAVFAAVTLTLISIGIFNEHYVPIHFLVSVIFFTLVPISLFILTSAFYLSRQRSMAVFTIAVGIAAALPWIFQYTFNYFTRVAIPETLSAIAVSVWVIIVVIKIIKQHNLLYI
ncbi:MAG: DUF998 domain-containing protein [Candidatus Bathyarchaeota archaeon]|nr:DUF998 domain-containing protein [Candidatus Bathyarchaeota archaeon]